MKLYYAIMMFVYKLTLWRKPASLLLVPSPFFTAFTAFTFFTAFSAFPYFTYAVQKKRKSDKKLSDFFINQPKL